MHADLINFQLGIAVSICLVLSLKKDPKQKNVDASSNVTLGRKRNLLFRKGRWLLTSLLDMECQNSRAEM